MRTRIKQYIVFTSLIMALTLLGLSGDGSQVFAAPPAQNHVSSGVSPQNKPDIKQLPMADQTIPGVPLRSVARDTGSVGVLYNDAQQFYDTFAEGVYLWVNGQVWGPASVPLGPMVNEYTPVSNSLSGAGTAQNPWRIVTVL